MDRNWLTDGRIEALEVTIDIMLDRLGTEVLAELVMIRAPIVEGDDRAL